VSAVKLVTWFFPEVKETEGLVRRNRGVFRGRTFQIYRGKVPVGQNPGCAKSERRFERGHSAITWSMKSGHASMKKSNGSRGEPESGLDGVHHVVRPKDKCGVTVRNTSLKMRRKERKRRRVIRLIGSQWQEGTEN